MIYEINQGNIPIKLWLDDADIDSMNQAINLSNFPYAFKHIALMPDAHVGYGMPIGGVMATKDVIVPNAVGVDIGCGMCAVKTTFTHIDTANLKRILGKIREFVPLGFNHHKEMQDIAIMPSPDSVSDFDSITSRQFNSARRQVGTLGGGNHFIEIQKGSDGFIYLMIHSGSRNIGKTVAEHYNNLAKNLNAKYKEIPEKWDLAFLHLDSDDGRKYLSEMEYCVKFALANRLLMMETVQEIVVDIAGDCDFDESINIPHNFASLEEHFGEQVWVHRKGATPAYKGCIGIIPGSQGTFSYIVEGLGNPESFESSSHGAGRKIGRNRAIKELDFDEEVAKMNKLGILHGIRSSKQLDEAPGAYKDIYQVMQNQSDLVKILIELSPLAVVKA
ncbi:MAG: RtcB family protein [Ignavibacteriae bacterium HGW-Ignavibacteriae-1]|jgi:tRNA-splicing ligase RtcB|nr:MAG: RtcB family protein [Ignavibacteriae bacterium HGW-Ignavibacteriae-1]